MISARRKTNYRSHISGFTLIELLIVVVIITILTGMIVPSLNTYFRNQSLKQAQEQVKSDMRTTQVKALTGTSSDEIEGGQTVLYWGMSFTNDSSSYNYFITSDADCTGEPKGSGDTLPNNVVFKNPPSCILFSMANGDITSLGGSSPLTIGYSGSSSNREVLFNASGLIYSVN